MALLTLVRVTVVLVSEVTVVTVVLVLVRASRSVRLTLRPVISDKPDSRVMVDAAGLGTAVAEAWEWDWWL